MATQKTTQPKTPTVPQPGSRPSIRVDEQLSDDLGVLMRAGGTTTDAVRAAVAQLADIYRTAWAQGVIPEGQRPHLLAFQLYEPQTATPAPTSRYDANADRPVMPRIGRRLPGPVAPTGARVRPDWLDSLTAGGAPRA